MAVGAVRAVVVIVATPVVRAIEVRVVAVRRVVERALAEVRVPQVVLVLVAIVVRVATARAMNGVAATVAVRAADAISAARGRSAISLRGFPCRSPSCPSARISA